MTPLGIATNYRRGGFAPIPVPFKDKNPGFSNWQNTFIDEIDLPKHFNGHPQNVGVLLGTPSRNLVDVDLDCREAVALAPIILPPTDMIFGRAGNPDSHREYIANPLVETEKFYDVKKDENGKQVMLVELRSTGTQTVFPGSVHESGEPITFSREGEPAAIEGDVLRALVSKLAAAALLAKHWPGEGVRHNAELALAGGLIRAGWAEEDATDFVVAIAETGGGEPDKESRKRVSEYTSKRIAQGKKATGWPTLIEIIGKDVVGRACEWLGIGKTKPATAFQLLDSCPDLDNIDTTKPVVVDKKDPLTLAKQFVRRRYNHPEHHTLLYADGEHWKYTGACWEIIKPDAIRQQLYNFVEPFKIIVKRGESEVFDPFKPTSRDIDNIADALRATTYTSARSPAWIGKDADKRPCLSNRPIVAATNGIFDVTGGVLTKISDPTPALYATSAIDYPLIENPCPPLAWLHFLADIFEDDQQQIDLLQEWFGYTMTSLTRLQKMLLLLGPPRSGKGTTARVLKSVLGDANVVAPTLAGIGTNFGLWPLIGKSLAIIGDARLSTNRDQAVVTERLLSISGEDLITIDIKNREPQSITLPTRIMLLSNELPKLADPSGALASRFEILRLRKSYLGNEDTGLTDKLMAERQSIAWWALQGLARLCAEWKFTKPAAADDLRAELDDLSAPIKAFLGDWCHVDPRVQIEAAELYSAWCAWCEEQGNDRPGTQQLFGRDLALPLPC